MKKNQKGTARALGVLSTRESTHHLGSTRMNSFTERRFTMGLEALIDAMLYGGTLILGLVGVLAMGMGMLAGK
jgi:hypothetical protein